MTLLSRATTPTGNKRLNELIGLLLFLSSALLLLSLVSGWPADPSLNTATTPLARPAANWIGITGAMLAGLAMQTCGVAVFLLPVFMFVIASRWFRSRKIESPGLKTFGAAGVLVFGSALLGLLPWHWRWVHAVGIEGLIGRMVADTLTY